MNSGTMPEVIIEGDTYLGDSGEDYLSLNYDACKLIESMAIRRKLGIN